MNWREAKSLLTLRDQVNAIWPNRHKESDGTIGDTRHQAEKSDHNPNSAGVVTAIDLTHDPNGCTGDWLATALQNSKDKRIKYLIWNRRITVKGDISQWKPYHGFSPHTEHVHISVSADPKLYDDAERWNLDDATSAVSTDTPAPSITVRDLQVGDTGQDVRNLQAKLGIKVDGSFGINTKAAVIGFQTRNDLRADGVVGENTRKALGL